MVLSDASHLLSGVKDVDQIRTLELALAVIKITQLYFKPHGSLIMKAFQGEEFEKHT